MNTFCRLVQFVGRRLAGVLRRGSGCWALTVRYFPAPAIIKEYKFQPGIQKGDLRNALTTLKKNDGESRGKGRLLY